MAAPSGWNSGNCPSEGTLTVRRRLRALEGSAGASWGSAACGGVRGQRSERGGGGDRKVKGQSEADLLVLVEQDELAVCQDAEPPLPGGAVRVRALTARETVGRRALHVWRGGGGEEEEERKRKHRNS